MVLKLYPWQENALAAIMRDPQPLRTYTRDRGKAFGMDVVVNPAIPNDRIVIVDEAADLTPEQVAYALDYSKGKDRTVEASGRYVGQILYIDELHESGAESGE